MPQSVTQIYYRVAQTVMGWYGYLLAGVAVLGILSVLILTVYLVIHISSLR